MTRCLKNNRQGKYGRHKYTLEEYGFDGERLCHEYKSYMERYGYGVVEKIERPKSFDFGLEPPNPRNNGGGEVESTQ